MSYWSCDNEAPRVYMFVGDEPWEVMNEAADFLREAKDRGEYLTSWTIGSEVSDGELKWYGTLVTSGAGYTAPWPAGPEIPAEQAREEIRDDDTVLRFKDSQEFLDWLADVQSDLTPEQQAVLDLPERCDRVLHVKDGFGNGWEKCGPNCNLQDGSDG